MFQMLCVINGESVLLAVASKIVIDQLIYAPIFTCVLYIFLQTAHMDIEGIPGVLQVC
jgi:hypothetical protein